VKEKKDYKIWADYAKIQVGVKQITTLSLKILPVKSKGKN
jgi:hypothetical protein